MPNNTDQPQPVQAPDIPSSDQVLRPWVVPTFERANLKDALENIPTPTANDNIFNFS